MRPKSFDENDILKTIEDTFRRVGYDGASLDVLTRDTGLNRSSLYNAFGSKNAMMRRAVETYTERSGQRIEDLLSARPMREAMRAFFASIAEPGARGCLIGNLVAERAEAESSDQAFLSARLGDLELRFEQAIREAQAEGEIDAGADPIMLARYVMTTTQGLRIMSLADSDCQHFESVIEMALNAMPFNRAG